VFGKSYANFFGTTFVVGKYFARIADTKQLITSLVLNVILLIIEK
jgi:hypothetical protein